MSSLTPAAAFDRRIETLGPEAVWREYYVPQTLARARRLAILREAVSARPAERIIDVGCGAGGLAYWSAAMGARVVGVDYSAASLRAARRAARPLGAGAPAYLQADVTHLPVRPGRFDAVVCVDVLDMLPRDRHAALLAELVGAVRPGGRILLYAPNARREALGRALWPLRRRQGAWQRPACPLHRALAGPARLRRLLRALPVRATLRFTDMNYPWLATLPLARAWLAGHMCWTLTRQETA